MAVLLDRAQVVFLTQGFHMVCCHRRCRTFISSYARQHSRHACTPPLLEDCTAQPSLLLSLRLTFISGLPRYLLRYNRVFLGAYPERRTNDYCNNINDISSSFNGYFNLARSPLPRVEFYMYIEYGPSRTARIILSPGKLAIASHHTSVPLPTLTPADSYGSSEQDTTIYRYALFHGVCFLRY